MPKLPDAGDLNVVAPRAARSFTNVPVADYQGAFGALGRGISDIGEGAQRYANEVDKRRKDEEAFGVNLRLADAQVQFSKTTAGLDPSDPEYSTKRMKAWSDTFKPIIESVQHPENKMRFGEWAYENGAKIQIDSDSVALTAKREKTKLELLDYIEKQKKLVADQVISPEAASANVRQQIASAPGLFDNDKLEFELREGKKFDAAAVQAVGMSLIGNARAAPDSWKNYEARLGPFLEAMKEAGYPIEIYSHFRAPEYQAKLYRQKVEELRRQGVANPEQAARKWVAAPGPDAPHFNGASDLSFNGVQLGKKGTEAATAMAHKIAGKYGLHFRMGHEPWHIEPVTDGSAPPVVPKRGQSEAAVVAIVSANPLFKTLAPEDQTTVLNNLRTQHRQLVEEDEKLNLLAGTRSVVDDIAALYPKPEDRDLAFAELSKRVKDPEYLEDARTMLKSTYAINDENIKANNDAILKDVSKKVFSFVGNKDIKGAFDAIETSKATDADKITLREFVRTGGALKDNQWIVDDLTAQSISKDEAQRKAFLETDISKLLLDRQITVETANKLIKAQKDIEEGKSVSQSYEAARPIINPRLDEIGLKIDAKSSPTDIAIRNRVESLIKRNLEAASNGSPLTSAQVEEITNSTLRQWLTEKPKSILNPLSWISSDTFSGATNIAEVMDIFQKKEDDLIANPDKVQPEKRVQYPGHLLERAYTEIEQGAEKKRRELQFQIGMARDDYEANRLRARLKALDKLTIDGSLLESWFRNEFPE